MYWPTYSQIGPSFKRTITLYCSSESSSRGARPFGSKNIAAAPGISGPCGFHKRLGYMKSFKPCFFKNSLPIFGKVSWGFPPHVVEKNWRGADVNLTSSSISTSKSRWPAGPSFASSRSLIVSRRRPHRPFGPFLILIPESVFSFLI